MVQKTHSAYESSYTTALLSGLILPGSSSSITIRVVCLLLETVCVTCLPCCKPSELPDDTPSIFSDNLDFSLEDLFPELTFSIYQAFIHCHCVVASPKLFMGITNRSSPFTNSYLSQEKNFTTQMGEKNKRRK